MHRLTGQQKYVSELTYDEIHPVLDHVYNSYDDQNSPVVNSRKLKPALFMDVLKMLQPHENISISVDVKTKKEEDLKEIIDILISMKMEERVMIGSFEYFDFNVLRKKYGWKNIAFFGGTKHCQKVIIGFLLGLVPFLDTDCDVFCFPHYFESTPNITDFPKFKNQFFMKIWTAYVNFTYKYFVMHLQKRNIPVCFWTINTEKDVEKCIHYNTNGIICDNPTTLLKYIEFKELS